VEGGRSAAALEVSHRMPWMPVHAKGRDVMRFAARSRPLWSQPPGPWGDMADDATADAMPPYCGAVQEGRRNSHDEAGRFVRGERQPIQSGVVGGRRCQHMSARLGLKLMACARMQSAAHTARAMHAHPPCRCRRACMRACVYSCFACAGSELCIVRELSMPSAALARCRIHDRPCFPTDHR
jgi:hypothetical protein